MENNNIFELVSTTIYTIEEHYYYNTELGEIEDTDLNLYATKELRIEQLKRKVSRLERKGYVLTSFAEGYVYDFKNKVDNTRISLVLSQEKLRLR